MRADFLLAESNGWSQDGHLTSILLGRISIQALSETSYKRDNR